MRARWPHAARMTLKTRPASRRLTIILDPGHGSVANAGLPGDPGAVGNNTTEAAANLLLCLTLKWALAEAGHKVYLTRTDERRPSWPARTNLMGRADLYLSVHHDTAKGRSMAYYAGGADYAGGPNPALSRKFAEVLDGVMPDPEFIVLSDTASNHGRLYIRSVLAPVAVMWEVDPVHVSTTPERIERAKSFLNALELACARGVL